MVSSDASLAAERGRSDLVAQHVHGREGALAAAALAVVAASELLGFVWPALELVEDFGTSVAA